MSNIGGERRIDTSFTKKVGLFEARVFAINPTEEEYIEKIRPLKDDSKETEYLGESKDGNTYLRLTVWMVDVAQDSMSWDERDKHKAVLYLEDRERENKDGTKKQYINNVGTCSWASEPDFLPDWFVKRDYRVAHSGEEELYEFMRSWLGTLNFASDQTRLELNWKYLMSGNVKELTDQIDGEWSTTFGAMAIISTKEKDGVITEWPAVYNRAFFPAYGLKYFRLVDYSDPQVLAKIEAKKPRDQKVYEKFALKVSGEYGCKDFFILKDIKIYDSNENIAASKDVIADSGPQY